MKINITPVEVACGRVWAPDYDSSMYQYNELLYSPTITIAPGQILVIFGRRLFKSFSLDL